MQEDKLLDYKNQEVSFLVNDIRDKNREKALSVVAPIDDALSNLTALGKMPKSAPGTSLDSMIKSATNKPKMVDYSDVKFEDVYKPYSDGTFTPRYETYSTVNLDQESFAASKQTSGDIWGYALPKFTGKVLTNTIGQLGGIVYGIGAAVNTGSMQSIYDNSFMDVINDANTYMDNKLPTYKSKADREATGLDYFTKQTTWADDFLNGSAFLGGAILSEVAIEWATGGAAASTALARWGTKLEQIPGFAKAINTARKMSNPAAKAFATGNLETKLATNLGKTGELLHTIRFTATSAGYESAFESNAYMKESESNYYNSFQELNGRMPTVEEQLDFRRNLKTSADALFGYNMAIVGSSNLAVMGKWFNVKSPLTAPNKWANSKLFGIGYKKVGEDIVETSATKFQKALGKTYGFTKPMFVEGIWEEGMQSVGQNTAQNWTQAKYDPKYTKNTYDLVDSFSDGLAQTYGTAEGWKEIQMGMLIGLIGGAAGNKVSTGKFNPDYAQAVAKNKLTVDTMNTYSGKRVAESMAYANRIQSANEASEKAEAAGDFTGAELARQSTALAQLNFAYNLDYMDDAVENTVTSIRNIDNQALMTEYGVDEKSAETMKSKMIEEYKETANSYKKYRDFSEYFIGNKLSSEERALLKNHDVVALKEALAYELTLGEKADKFSSDILQAIKEKVGTTVAGQEVSDAMTIDDILTKAGKETKREGEKKVSEITKLKGKLNALEEEYKKVQNTFYNSVSEEEKKTLLGKLDSITSQKQEVEAKRAELAQEYEVLFTAAKMKNPFSKDGSSIVITAAKLDVLRDQAASVKSIISEYKKSNPQESAQLEKLVEEYGKSLDAFQKYADLSRQITDPTLGLRGKRNFISEIRRDKSPNEVTVEMLELLSPRMAQAVEQVTQATLEGNERVKEVIEEGEEKKKGAKIEKPKTEQKEAKKEDSKKSIKDTVKDMIKNSPYLLEYYGEEAIPQVPTSEEIEEFYELAARAIDDPKIDTDLIAFKNPYNYKRFSPTTRPSLKKAEVTRLQELNNKMADWQLLEGATNGGGVSINDMILQDIAVNQFVEPIISNEVAQEELIKTANQFPKETESGEGIRNEEVLQVYQDVVLKRTKKGTTISHMTLPGLLSRMDISDTVLYIETRVVKGKEEAVPGSAKEILVSEVEQNVKQGANFVITFNDGNTATVTIEKSGSLLIKKDTDFKAIIAAAEIDYVDNALTKESGFSPVYDLRTGLKMETDFKDSSMYSPTELYNMIPGDTVTFSLDLTNEYNLKLIQDYADAVVDLPEEGAEDIISQLEKDLSDQLKINVLDIKGRKLGDLKANYDTNNSPEFLLIREEALNIIKSKGEITASDIDLQLSKESFIKHIFLGMPNFVFEEGAIKYFDVPAEAVVDYGYIQNGKVILKGNTKNVRQDYVKGLLKKEGLPIVVFKQGKYLVAFPMQLKTTEAKLGDTTIDELASSKNLGAGVLALNNTLANNGLSPAAYNLYYVDSDNQSLFSDNGQMSNSLSKAIEDLNKVKQTVDVSTWMLPEHTKANLTNEASVAIDIENNPLSSPKPIINLDKMVDIKRDWYSDAITTGNLSLEKATEISNKILFGEPLTTQEYDLSDHPAVQFLIDEYMRLNPDQQSDVDDAKNEPC
jgi:hypothetical protein